MHQMYVRRGCSNAVFKAMAMRCNEEALKQLMATGADVKATYADGQTAFIELRLMDRKRW